MPNPPLVFVDSDVVIQTVLASAFPIFRFLKSVYAIQPVIVPEVEVELRSLRKFKAQVTPVITKAISNGNLKVFDAAAFAFLATHNPAFQIASAGVSYTDIQILGAALHRRVDRGEAYTFATAQKLNLPAISNDFSAIQVLLKTGIPLPPSICRTYDLIALSYQAGHHSEQSCEDFRRALLVGHEHIQAEFRSCSFREGIVRFCPRLIDDSKVRVGIAYSGAPGFQAPVLISAAQK